MSTAKPREFWIIPSDTDVLVCVYEGLEQVHGDDADIDECLHLIEHSAYAELEHKLKASDNIVEAQLGIISAINLENAKLKAELAENKSDMTVAYMLGNENMKDKNKALESKLAKAVEALEFYGDKRNWKEEDIGSMTRPQYWKALDADEGSNAREALAQIRGES